MNRHELASNILFKKQSRFGLIFILKPLLIKRFRVFLQALHRFFAEVCLDADLLNEKGQRLNPIEWFVVPFKIIEETIQLALNENIINFEYDPISKKIIINYLGASLGEFNPWLSLSD